MSSKVFTLVDEQNVVPFSVLSDLSTLCIMWSCTLLPIVAVGFVGYLLSVSVKDN
jgi:nitrate reductase NapE component